MSIQGGGGIAQQFCTYSGVRFPEGIEQFCEKNGISESYCDRWGKENGDFFGLTHVVQDLSLSSWKGINGGGCSLNIINTLFNQTITKGSEFLSSWFEESTSDHPKRIRAESHSDLLSWNFIEIKNFTCHHYLTDWPDLDLTAKSFLRGASYYLDTLKEMMNFTVDPCMKEIYPEGLPLEEKEGASFSDWPVVAVGATAIASALLVTCVYQRIRRRQMHQQLPQQQAGGVNNVMEYAAGN